MKRLLHNTINYFSGIPPPVDSAEAREGFTFPITDYSTDKRIYMKTFISCCDRHGEGLSKTLDEALRYACGYLKMSYEFKSYGIFRESKVIVDDEEGFIRLYTVCSDDGHILEVEKVYKNQQYVIPELLSEVINELRDEDINMAGPENTPVSVRVENFADEIAELEVSTDVLSRLLKRIDAIDSGPVFSGLDSPSGAFFPSFTMHMPRTVVKAGFKVTDRFGTLVSEKCFVNVSDALKHLSALKEEAEKLMQKEERIYTVTITGSTDDTIYLSFSNTYNGIYLMNSLITSFKKMIAE